MRNRPAAERFDASQQFGIGVGLRQIIVAACPQALDAIVDLAQRGQEQHRRRIAGFAQVLHQTQPVQVWQHAFAVDAEIEYDQTDQKKDERGEQQGLDNLPHRPARLILRARRRQGRWLGEDGICRRVWGQSRCEIAVCCHLLPRGAGVTSRARTRR